MSRRINAGAWRLANIRLITESLIADASLAGAPAIPPVYPQLLLTEGTQVDWMPDSTKTGAQDGTMETFFQDNQCCCITQLSRCLAAYAAAEHHVADFITRPLARDKRSFNEEATSSAGIARRLKLHLRAAGVYRGQTVHGTRRGSMQHAVFIEGQSVEEVARRAQIRTPGIVNRYIDRQGHIDLEV